MKPLIEDPDLTLYCGDALAVLRELDDESVQTCVTSPPYWGLRDYGVEGQVGLEPTIGEYVAAMVEIFREVRRVLRDDGTLWLNLGDSYAGGGGYSPGSPSNVARQEALAAGDDRDGPFIVRGEHNYMARQRDRQALVGLKPKDLCMIPARVALALQDDGWWLRSEIIWAKPNVMPESVTDRPTRAHEQIYLFAKSERYYFDQDAVREPYGARVQQRLTPTSEQPGAVARLEAGGLNPRSQGGDVGFPPPQTETLDGLEGEAPRGPDGRRVTHVEAGDGSIQPRSGERWPGMRRSGNKERKHGRDVGAPGGTDSDLGRGIPWEEDGRGRNVRTVWEITTESSKEAHFAIFPRELARRCIAAGSAEGDVVLDPFMGSGTVAHVARAMHRHSIGIELNPAYCDLIARTQQLSLEA